MAFVVKYLQDIPNNCSECPCSIHIAKNEVYCNARQKHFEVTDKRPEECGMMECDDPIEPDEMKKSCANCKHGKYNDLFKTKFCYNDNDCKDWNLWEAKE